MSPRRLQIVAVGWHNADANLTRFSRDVKGTQRIAPTSCTTRARPLPCDVVHNVLKNGTPPILSLTPGSLLLLSPEALCKADRQRTRDVLVERGMLAVGITDGLDEATRRAWRETGVLRLQSLHHFWAKLDARLALGDWAWIRIEELGVSLDDATSKEEDGLRALERAIPCSMETWSSLTDRSLRTRERACQRLQLPTPGALRGRMTLLREELGRRCDVPPSIRAACGGYRSREAYFERIRTEQRKDTTWLDEALARRDAPPPGQQEANG